MAEPQAPETQTADPVAAPEQSTAADTQEFDPYAVDVDELKTKIESEIYAEEPAEDAPQAATEEVPSEEVESPESVVDDDEVSAAPPATPDTDEPAVDATEADELRAALEVQEAQAKHFESLLRSRGGEEGFFKQKSAQLEQQMAALQAQVEGREDDYPATPERATPKPQQQPRMGDPNTTYLVGMAIKDAANSFLQNTPAVFKEVDGQRVVDPDLATALQEVMAQDATAIVESTDPIQAQSQVTAKLSAAWNKVDLKRKKDNHAEIKRRRAEQGKRLVDKKRASSASSTGSPTARRQSKTVDPFKMPLDEVRKLAEAEAEAMDG